MEATTEDNLASGLPWHARARRAIAPSNWIDRHLLLAMTMALLLVLPRTLLVASAHSETIDEEYHLFRGVQLWLSNLEGITLNDPPTGEALIALPLWLAGIRPLIYKTGLLLHNQPIRVETLLLMVAAWKALLFVPFAGVVFAWVRRLFGAAAAWLATGLICLDPTFAGHIAPGTLDVIGVEGIVIACFAWWRYFEKPTLGRLVAATLLGTLAMTLKHTAIILPGVWLILLISFWIGRYRQQSARRLAWHLPVAGVLSAVAITVLTGGIRTPYQPREWRKEHRAWSERLNRPLPAGYYIAAIIQASEHSAKGHRAYLQGEKSWHGWTRYFPIVATYKVPVGFFVVGGLGLLSLGWRRPRFEELGLLVPMAAWTAFVVSSPINIGFRHFLPPYAFMLMWAGGRAMTLPRWGQWTALAATGVAAVHVALWHPNYISYVNWPRDRVWVQISDSNLDWGQGLKQIRQWIDARPRDGRPIYLNYFGRPDSTDVAYYLGDRVRPITNRDPIPPSGLLIISPVNLMHVYDNLKTYRRLQRREPVEMIGDSLLVFDLDEFTGPSSRPGP